MPWVGINCLVCIRSEYRPHRRAHTYPHIHTLTSHTYPHIHASHTCVHTLTYMCTYPHIHAHTLTYMCTYPHIHVYIPSHTCVHIPSYTCVHTLIYMCTYPLHTLIYMCTYPHRHAHTYPHTYTPTCMYNMYIPSLTHPHTYLTYTSTYIPHLHTHIHTLAHLHFLRLQIWANIQPYEDPSRISFDLSNSTYWRPLFPSDMAPLESIQVGGAYIW